MLQAAWEDAWDDVSTSYGYTTAEISLRSFIKVSCLLAGPEFASCHFLVCVYDINYSLRLSAITRLPHARDV